MVICMCLQLNYLYLSFRVLYLCLNVISIAWLILIGSTYWAVTFLVYAWQIHAFNFYLALSNMGCIVRFSWYEGGLDVVSVDCVLSYCWNYSVLTKLPSLINV